VQTPFPSVAFCATVLPVTTQQSLFTLPHCRYWFMPMLSPMYWREIAQDNAPSRISRPVGATTSQLPPRHELKSPFQPPRNGNSPLTLSTSCSA
jgi:hypothetical protein